MHHAYTPDAICPYLIHRRRRRRHHLCRSVDEAATILNIFLPILITTAQVCPLLPLVHHAGASIATVGM